MSEEAGHDGTIAIPEPSEAALQFYWSGNFLWMLRRALELLIPAGVLLTGLSARFRCWAQQLGRRWPLVVALYFLAYSALVYALTFPLALYAGFFRLHAYGLSNQTFGKWFADSLKLAGVEYLAWLVGLLALYFLLRKAPRRWWLYLALFLAPYAFFMALVFPIWVAPLFNEFGPMKDKALEADILALAERAGIDADRVYEVDKSVDTTALNAYVAGLGRTQRIVLWDTIIERLDREELLVVMAHEMGHYVLGHVFTGVGLAALGTFLFLYLMYKMASWLTARYGARLGFMGLHDVAALPLLLVLFAALQLLQTPIMNAVSRHFEREADRFAVELTRNNRSGATAFVKLAAHNLSNPRPGRVFMFWRASHPSIAERIEFFNAYRPWDEGRPGRYDNYFAPSPAAAHELAPPGAHNGGHTDDAGSSLRLDSPGDSYRAVAGGG